MSKLKLIFSYFQSKSGLMLNVLRAIDIIKTGNESLIRLCSVTYKPEYRWNVPHVCNSCKRHYQNNA